MEVVKVVEPSERYYDVRLTETEMNIIMIGIGAVSQSTIAQARGNMSAYATSKIPNLSQAQTIPLWNDFRRLLGHIPKETQ